MQSDESELEMARRHVVAGRKLVERQQAILAELRADGHPTTDIAEQLLADLQQSQVLHEAHLSRVESENSAAGHAT